MIREPAVAGQFYPAEPEALRADVERCLEAGAAGPGRPTPSSIVALVVPHAGYVYSGRVAGAVYAVSRLPDRLVLLGPNHTGRGAAVGVAPAGSWRTPLGPATVDEKLTARIMMETCPMAEIDAFSHEREHALEVQIPFLQVKVGPRLSFAAVCVGTHDAGSLVALGRGVASAILAEGGSAGIVVSTDMSHYIPAVEARALDMLAIERMLRLDVEGLDRVVRDKRITMCGIAPAVAGLAAARDLGAGSARLVAYANSGDVNGDYTAVVGYAGLTVS